MIELSDSQDKTFHRCRRLWAYTKVLKLDPGEDKDNMVFGDACHQGLEEYVQSHDLAKSCEIARKAMEEGKSQVTTERFPWFLLVAPALVQGWATHFYPRFRQDWDYVAAEEWVEYQPHPMVKIRMYVDAFCRHRQTGRLSVWDYKTSGSKDGGDLGKTLNQNRQLALYSVATKRVKGDWPQSVGLIFLGKPKTKDPLAAAEQAAKDPTLFFHLEQQVTPAFAAYALDVEAGMVLTGQEMQAIKSAVDKHGPAALDAVPANPDGCFKYNNFCGFSTGCHCGRPAHRDLTKKPA